MAFPNSHKFTYTYDNHDGFGFDELFQALVFAFQDAQSDHFEVKEKSIEFGDKAPVFSIPYLTKIELLDATDKIKIQLTVQLDDLLKIILIISILIALISTFTFSGYLTFALIFAVLFFCNKSRFNPVENKL